MHRARQRTNTTLRPSDSGATARPLPAPVRHYFEPRFGFDFGRIRIYTDAQADLLAKSAGARAYTVGSGIVFREGAFSPETERGRQLLAHELTHAIQQREREDGGGAFAVSDVSDGPELQADHVARRIASPAGAEMRNDVARILAETPVHAHVARQVEQPIVAKAPATAMSIDRFSGIPLLFELDQLDRESLRRSRQTRKSGCATGRSSTSDTSSPDSMR